MVIKNLGNTDIKDIVECLTKSFRNYFVEMPTEVAFWVTRFHLGRVDFDLSFGAFDNDELVAFIITGIDVHDNVKTAFNTGTGVLEEYRGQKLVDQIYSKALPVFRAHGVGKCMLEVVEQNNKAIRVYNRIGFQKDRLLRCFSGTLIGIKSNATIQEIDITNIKETILQYQHFYSWDNSLNAILIGGDIFKTYIVQDNAGLSLGYFIINTDNDSLIQFEAFEAQNWMHILSSISKIIPSIRINNIDSGRKKCINALGNAGIKNHINQYEMTLFI